MTATVTRRYLAGLGVHAQQVLDGQGDPVRYLHGDLVRSTMLLMDEAGSTGVSPVNSYTAFGEAVWDGGVGVPPAGFGTRYRYAGGWGYESGGFDGAPSLMALYGANPALPPLTLQHVGWRWYQPGIGRFVERDPNGIIDGMNVYAYVEDDPPAGFDPDGLATVRPVKTPWGWRNPANGRWAKPPWLLRKIPKVVPYSLAYYPAKWCVRGAYGLAGEPWPGDPFDQAWDLVTDLRDLAEREAAVQRLINEQPDVFPPPPLPRYIPGMCFVDGTLILTSQGMIPIENVGPGTAVAGQSGNCAEKTWTPVTQVHAGFTRELVAITLENETLQCTPAHPFWCVNRGWVAAGDLTTRDCLLNSRLEPVAVLALERVALAQAVRIHNLTVSGTPTYFVGSSEVLVHNKQ